MKRILQATILAGLLAVPVVPASAEDRHEGYYYPPLTDKAEQYEAKAKVLPEANRALRVAFVTDLTRQQFAGPYPPQYAIYAKGSEAEKLIIVALEDDIFRTLFRARTVLAQLTAHARSTEFFKSNSVDDYFTFFDLCRLLGFEQLTISDGQTWSHRIGFGSLPEPPTPSPQAGTPTPNP